MDKPEKPVLFVGWFCPFAQRTWISFEHLKFEYKLVNSVDSVVLDEGYRYMLKGQQLIDATPQGKSSVVPLVIWDEKTDPQREKPSQGSIDLSTANCLPDHPFCKGKEKLKELDSALCGSDFYGALKSPNEDDTCWKKWTGSLEQFASSLVGPFYLGSDFTVVDAVVFPFIYRAITLDIFKVFKSRDITELHCFSKIQTYVNACLVLPEIKATLPKDTDMNGFSKSLLAVYAVYAEGIGLKSLLPGEAIPEHK